MPTVGPNLSLTEARQRPSRVRFPSAARVVTVFSAKGGCGKTTLATNLSVVLADHGRRPVCLVDLDLAFGDVAIALGLFPEHTIAEVLPLSGNLDAASLVSLLTSYSPGLTTLLAPIEPGTAESIPVALVETVLDVLKQIFDFVVIDTPPALDDHVLAAFDRSDDIVLLSTPDVSAMKNLQLTLETLDLLSYPRDRWRIVINRSTSGAGSGDGLSQVLAKVTPPIPVSAYIPASRDVSRSINRGIPLVIDDPKAPVSQAIINFANALVH